MAKNFHELYQTELPPLPSERSTGLVFTAVCMIIAYFWSANGIVLTIALCLAALFLAASLLAPHLLKHLNIAWFKLALVLNKVVSPIVMLVLFLLTIVPAGLIMQVLRDPLQKRRKRDANSYWIERDKDWPVSSMTNQF